ncbi:MAG: PPC domain-containing protein [Chloroflexota bacterium]
MTRSLVVSRAAPLLCTLALIAHSHFNAIIGHADLCAEPNDSPPAACRLSPDTQVEGFIESFGDVDLYALELGEGANLRIDMVPPGDFRMSLQTIDGTVIVRPSGEGSAPRQIRYKNQVARTYVIRIESAQGDASSVLPYTLVYRLEADGAGDGKQVTAPPSGPGLTGARPHDIILRIDEVGREAKQEYARDGSLPDSQWVEMRYERPRTFRGMRSGWVSIMSRVTVTNDIATAQRLYRDLSDQGFPEATEPMGPEFFPDTGTIGDESTAKGNCQNTCVQEEPLMHMRIVFRQANAVVLLYTWGMGGTEGATAESAAWLARQMAGRI